MKMKEITDKHISSSNQPQISDSKSWWHTKTWGRKGDRSIIDNSYSLFVGDRMGCSKDPSPDDLALIIPRGDLVSRNLNRVGVMECWSDGVRG